MNATIIARTPTSFTLQVEIPYNGSMLDFGSDVISRAGLGRANTQMKITTHYGGRPIPG